MPPPTVKFFMVINILAEAEAKKTTHTFFFFFGPHK